MTAHDVFKVVGAVIAGSIMGWAGTALTLTGRVDAIEKALARIEQRLGTTPEGKR